MDAKCKGCAMHKMSFCRGDKDATGCGSFANDEYADEEFLDLAHEAFENPHRHTSYGSSIDGGVSYDCTRIG